MQIETKHVYTKCDVCNSRIKEGNTFYNSGEYSVNLVKVGTLDICPSCCVKLFERMAKKEDVYEAYINDLVTEMQDVRNIFQTKINPV